MTKTRVTLSQVLIILVSVTLGGVAGSTIQKSFSSQTPSPTISVPQKIEDSPGFGVKTDDMLRREAAEAVNSLLNQAGTIVGSQELLMEAAKKLDDDSFSAKFVELDKKIRFIDSASDPNVKKITYQALISFVSAISGKQKYEEPLVVLPGVEKSVHLDREARLAYVPLGMYLGKDGMFSFPLSYIDGQWVLQPYSILEEIKLSASVSKMINEGKIPSTPPSTTP